MEYLINNKKISQHFQFQNAKVPNPISIATILSLKKKQSSRERKKKKKSKRSKDTTKGKRLALSVQNETINASRRGNNFVYFVRFSGSSVGFSGNKSRLTVFICICMQCVTSFAMIYVPMVPWN